LGIIVGKDDLTEVSRDHAGDTAAAAAATFIDDRLEQEKDDALREGLEDRDVLWK
jgi:hypothetical protein